MSNRDRGASAGGSVARVYSKAVLRRVALLAAGVATVGASTLTAVAGAAGHETHTWEHDVANRKTGGPTYSWTCTSNKYAQACFAEAGEWFHLYDNRKDGLSPAVEWQVVHRNNGNPVKHRQGWIWHLAGADKVRLKNKSFPEETTWFRVCAGDHGDKGVPGTVDRATCTKWKYGGE